MKEKHDDWGFATRAIHAGWDHKDGMGAVSPPIYQSSTFAFHDSVHGEKLFLGEGDGYIYTRMGNPTTHALEECIANLEGGFGAIATASGMGAVATAYMTFLGQGLHLVATSSVYGPSRVVIERDFSRFGVEATFVDTSNFEEVRKAIRPETRLVFLETPANPTLAISDIKKIATLCKEKDIILMVDNGGNY